jgi:hypothetical protein
MLRYTESPSASYISGLYHAILECAEPILQCRVLRSTEQRNMYEYLFVRENPKTTYKAAFD